MSDTAKLAAVAIGRNEGERLVRSLASLQGRVGRIVYVDSGSTDGSVEAAHAAGAEVVELDPNRLFTVSRARNAGFFHLLQTGEPPDLVQFIDGDCEVQQGWIETAVAFLDAHPDIAAVSGRRRERYPDATIWNWLIDAEWAKPAGETVGCGGDVMMRREALEAVGGYDPDTIVGEEAELCIRMRRKGWRIWQLEDEMTLHDVAMTRFGQWWRRNRRGGYGYGEAVALYGAPPERHKVVESRRAILWGLVLPAAAVIGALVTPWALLLLMAWPAQVLRLTYRGVPPLRAVFLVIGKVPEALGILEFWIKRRLLRTAERIDYK
ncbi:glycosyltransferase [Roseibacterium sp. SDUM158017]|uniref:glycosyltransferase n=1 Tax=Roseicyclus salinarum TaxID=3036773 RepID=UPI0024152763|nr:glycosyltransferase family 2 protein [Roseibacterium sp. SDUM158017]MDG4649643.1 glycosyltransferase [Roseibacterium sp. SDUM158017]